VVEVLFCFVFCLLHLSSYVKVSEIIIEIITLIHDICVVILFFFF